MKQFVLVALAVMLVAGVSIAQELKFQIPNLEYTKFIDFSDGQGQLRDGVTSKFLGISDIDFRIGAMDTAEPGVKKPVLAISYDIRKLSKLGANVKYFWGDMNLTVCGGISYDFNTSKVSGCAAMVLAQINFGQ